MNEELKKGDGKGIRLLVRSLGHVPALKNSMFAIVKKENREWKKKCVNDFVFQLLSGTATVEQGTQTLPLPPCTTASLPQDDSWRDIPETHVYCEGVAHGEEGADILIVEIKDTP